MLMTLIGLASGLIAWKLVRNHTAANGITVLPICLIQTIGVVLLAGLGFAAYTQGNIILLVEGLVVAFSMILISKRIKKRQNENAEQGSGDNATTSTDN